MTKCRVCGYPYEGEMCPACGANRTAPAPEPEKKPEQQPEAPAPSAPVQFRLPADPVRPGTVRRHLGAMRYSAAATAANSTFGIHRAIPGGSVLVYTNISLKRRNSM